MAEPRGSFIWYELITSNPDAAKRFYDAVVGWDIEPQPAGEMDYRMIRRPDGGHAGGLLVLTDAMISGGARPAWLGYVAVPDVDAAVAGFDRDHAGGSLEGRLEAPEASAREDRHGIGRARLRR